MRGAAEDRGSRLGKDALRRVCGGGAARACGGAQGLFGMGAGVRAPAPRARSGQGQGKPPWESALDAPPFRNAAKNAGTVDFAAFGKVGHDQEFFTVSPDGALATKSSISDVCRVGGGVVPVKADFRALPPHIIQK